MKLWTLTLAAVAALVFAPAARANFLVNGSFEAPATPLFVPVYPGQPTIPGWAVTAGSVDVANQSAFLGTRPAFDGAQFVDLTGTPGAGRLEQQFASTPGETYLLSFAYWFHPLLVFRTSTVDVSAGTAAASFSTAPAQDGWRTGTLLFTATGPTTTVRFAQVNTNSLFFGTLLDGVAVHAVPPPAAAVVLAAGAGLLGLVRRRAA